MNFCALVGSWHQAGAVYLVGTGKGSMLVMLASGDERLRGDTTHQEGQNNSSPAGTATPPPTSLSNVQQALKTNVCHVTPQC